jgi:hypothetical protein
VFPPISTLSDAPVAAGSTPTYTAPVADYAFNPVPLKALTGVYLTIADTFTGRRRRRAGRRDPQLNSGIAAGDPEGNVLRLLAPARVQRKCHKGLIIHATQPLEAVLRQSANQAPVPHPMSRTAVFRANVRQLKHPFYE